MMITNTQELRIGNLVHDDMSEVAIVESIESEKFNTWNGADEYLVKFSIGGDIKESQVFGFMLTEEWLVKLGFAKLGEGDIFWILEYDMRLKISSDLSMVAWCNLMLHGVTIKYVHQLQNLYFILTGQELTLQQ